MNPEFKRYFESCGDIHCGLSVKEKRKMKSIHNVLIVNKETEEIIEEFKIVSSSQDNLMLKIGAKMSRKATDGKHVVVTHLVGSFPTE